jgi:hypothetical protein
VLKLPPGGHLVVWGACRVVLSVMLVAHGLGEVCAGLPCPRFWVLALLSGSPGVIHTAKLIFFLKMCVLKILSRR